MKSKIATFIGTVGSIIGLIGWFGFRSIVILLLGLVLYLVELLMGWTELTVAAHVLDIIVFGIGCIVGAFTKTEFYIVGIIAVLLFSAVLGIVGFVIDARQK